MDMQPNDPLSTTFAALADRSLTTGELATAIGVDARALGIHLGMLAAMGFVERREGRWRATAASRTWLHPQADGYAGPLIHRFKENQPFHVQLLETLRTGTRVQNPESASAEWERGEMVQCFTGPVGSRSWRQPRQPYPGGSGR